MQNFNDRIIEKFTKKDGTNYKFSLTRIDKILNSIFISLNSSSLDVKYLIDNLNKWYYIKEIKKENFYFISYDTKMVNIDVSNDFLIQLEIVDGKMIFKNIVIAK